MDLDTLRLTCLKLPGVLEDIKWGNDLCFLIGGKMFCVCGLSPPLKVSLKVNDDEFEDRCSRPGIVPAPYLARYKWILVENTGLFSKNEWNNLIENSYRLVKSRLSSRTLKALGLENK